MTAAEPTNRLDPAQHTAAKVAGLMYLVTIVTASFSVGRLIVPRNSARIAAAEPAFRLAIVSELLTTAGVVVLLLALYVVLKPVNRNQALLAAFWRLVECSVFALILLVDLVALRLLSGADYLKGLDTGELQGVARVFLDVHADGYLIGLVFFGLGSTLFAYLWFKSRYIPRVLAAWGLFASAVVAAVSLAILVFPSLAEVVIPIYFAPIFIFEVGLGIWLLARGLRPPAPGDSIKGFKEGALTPK